MTLKQTPLNAVHRRFGAKLVDFGGREMPLHYGSQIEEHHAVRREAGMFDVSHMLAMDVTGPQAKSFLQGLLANDVGRLQKIGKALYSCMLNDAGGILDDLIVYFLGEQRYRLVVNAGTADKDVAWIVARRDGVAARVNIVPRRDLAMIAIQGPKAREKTWLAMPGAQSAAGGLDAFYACEWEDFIVARTGYTGEDGFEVMLPAEKAECIWMSLHAAGVVPAGLGARDTLRLEAGMNLYGHDMDETVTPLECGLDWTVDLESARDFVGKSALLAFRPRLRMLGLLLLDKGVLRAHQQIHTSAGPGEITSGTFSPTLGRSIALARVPVAVQPEEMVKVNVRDRWLPARTVKYPFVRNGRSLLGGAVAITDCHQE